MVFRPEADDDLGVRPSESLEGSSDHETGAADGVRVCRGIELDPKFVDVEVERWHSYMSDAGKDPDVYLVRDGQKLTYEEVVTDMPKL